MFFLFNVVIVFLSLALSSSQVMGNELHDIIIEKFQFTTSKESNVAIVEQGLKSFCQFIDKNPKLALGVDDYNFLPIDLLILVIKSLGKNGTEKSGQATKVGKALIDTLVKLSGVMFQQGISLHSTGSVRIIETNAPEKQHYPLSYLGFLLSPLDVTSYSLHEYRELQGAVGQTNGLSRLECLAFQALCNDDHIKASMNLEKVTCISSIGPKAAPVITSTPLHIAVQCFNKELVAEILSKPGIDINEVDGSNYTPLMRAVGADNSDPLVISDPDNEIIELLIQHKNIELNTPCKASGSTVVGKKPLEIALHYGFTDLEQRLKERNDEIEKLEKLEEPEALKKASGSSSNFSNSFVQGGFVITAIAACVGLAFVAKQHFKKEKDSQKQHINMGYEQILD